MGGKSSGELVIAQPQGQALHMRSLRVLALISLLGLSGCSYSFDVRAVMIDGRLAFVAEGPSSGQAKCVTSVRVLPQDYEPGREGEPTEAWAQRAYAWSDHGDYDCDDHFPIFYGAPLKGTDESGLPDVAAKPLRVGTIYEVSAVAGATGYGAGRFTLLPDGSVENLGRQ